MTTVVVKLGGHALEASPDASLLLDGLADDLLALRDAGDAIVLVHGGGPQINALVASLGIETTFVDGLRVTTDAILQCVVMGLSMVNATLVAELVQRGVPAVGLHGASLGLLTCTQRSNTLGAVGLNPVADATVLDVLLAQGMIPIVAPYAADSQGRLVNCNADAAAGAVANALRADALLLLSDIDQVRLDAADPASAIAELSSAQARDLLATGAAKDGMKPKVESALQAIDCGASRVVIGNGSHPHSVRNVLTRTVPVTEVTA
jgi:acetylglutamate kinase